jgi:hypothetical protein
LSPKKVQGGGWGQWGQKWKKRLANKDQGSQQTDPKIKSRIFIRKVGHLFLYFKFLLGFTAIFIKEPDACFV